MEHYSTMKVTNSLVENCFAVIELLAREGRSVRLSEIAQTLQLQRSGTHRLLSTLCALGWVEQDQKTEFYRLTLKLSAIGYRYLQVAQIPDICQPIIDRAATECKELVRLAGIVGSDLITFAHAQGATGSLICQPRTFPVLPLHVTASGKAWLATLADEKALKLVLDAGFDYPGGFGPNALRSADALLQELARTRDQGYGVAIEEAEVGVSSVAAAVISNQGNAVGAVAIVAPALRLHERRIPELAELARRTAEELAFMWPLRQLLTEHEPSS
ncbi:IclR family transcriptional regulator [Sinorhizobium sp. 8-89]|uniref:IclR family transcriptional regulator n=1 Tax=Sinorhizobium sp. 7-81 TaxID=3049087 RepID=UPI0024C26C7A|nr:IclR family transcriptional regulator [Sinorhizobium sp. 7-81]MDK1389786.1 IclR family transcriptional regulator [Sinorhizobium sp. 7-81]